MGSGSDMTQTTVVKDGGLVYARIDNFYTEEELKDLYEEFNYLEGKVLTAEENGNGVDEQGFYKNTGSGVMLDIFYDEDRSKSKILSINRKLFNFDTSELIKESCFFKHIPKSTADSTLINFYKSGERYRSHNDTSTLSAVTFFKKGNFKGGGLIFTDYNHLVPFQQNTCIIFPGCVEHQTEDFVGNLEDVRITMAQFIGYKNKR